MKKIIPFLFILSLSFSPIVSLAQQGGPTGPQGGPTGGTPIDYKITIPSPLKICPGANCSIPNLITVLIDSVVIPIGAVIAVLMIMYAGFLFVTARGDETQIKKAREAILYAVIGAAILLGAKLMATAIQSTITQLQ